MPLPFHPLINEWFASTYGKPTPVQSEAWPLIAKGEHVLAVAPTGSGKTLTGFLSAISRFADGTYPWDKLSVLYVSPLKALNEDIRRNLTFPLEGIRSRFEKDGMIFPSVTAATRSGDTPQAERRRFLLRPPSILALTPESLGILLLNPRSREILKTVRYVILDEIHTALGSKRGSYLSCQIDRLAITAGEFQRIALSATVKTPEAAAEFSGGLRKTGQGFEKRKVQIVSPAASKEIRFSVVFPGTDEKSGGENPAGKDMDAEAEKEHYGKRYAELIRFIIERIKANKTGNTILVFTDSRRRAERINSFLNQAAEDDEELRGRPLSYTHHGSLSKEVRRAVEKALASGEISCVVATGSLELGIDIGGVEEVILAGSPGSASQALQRIGRSGHGVGMTSRGWLMPFHGTDLLQAAAVSLAVEERELEETRCIENPLDILAQIILALCAEREWNENELYETIRGFYVYRNLSRKSYDSVIRMLTGAYEETRVRELKRQIFRDDETETLNAAPGALLLLYTSGGVITSRGLYSLRLAPGTEGAGTKIGELDEEFVWERRTGDTFDFGNRSWKISAITDEAVEAVPLPQRIDYAPFWKGDPVYRGDVLTGRMLEILESGGPKAEMPLHGLSDEAKSALKNFLYAQKSFQGKIPLPGRFFIPVEIIDNPAGRGDSCSVILHTFRGGAVNYPLFLAIAKDLEDEYGLRIEGTANDNAVNLRIPRSVTDDSGLRITASLRRLCEGKTGEARFRERLESSGVFGAAFREAAERSLLLPRSPYGKRIPLWLIRQRSKRLFDAISPCRDFPVSAEAWRTCLKETFDIEGFNSLLEGINSGGIKLGFFKTKQPSPFSKEVAWAETGILMYTYDERPDLMGHPSKSKNSVSVSDEVIAEALGNAAARPPLKAEIVKDFCFRLRREIPSWAPEDVLALCEWVKERAAVPSGKTAEERGEWERLLEYIPDELSAILEHDKSLGGKLIVMKFENAKTHIVVHRETAKKWKNLSAPEIASRYLGRWLRYEGPVPVSRIADIFGLTASEAEDAVLSLCEQGELVREVSVEEAVAPDTFIYGGDNLVCDRENLELLLRLSRKKRRPEIKERPAHILVPFIARRQGIIGEKENRIVQQRAPADAAGLLNRPNNISSPCQGAPWEKLSGFAAPAKLWETEFFPCRSPSYSGEMLDSEIREGAVIWYGAGKEKTAFCAASDLDIVLPGSPEPFSNKLPSGFFNTPRTFWEIKDAFAASIPSGGENKSVIDKTAKSLWEEVWRGSLSSDSWEPLRKAVESGFTAASEKSSEEFPDGFVSSRGRARRIPRAIKERWKAGAPVRGSWFSLAPDCENPSNSEETDLLYEEELNRGRVRLLLNRWGILARPLLELEGPAMSWSRLLPTMRRMELSGEIVTGRFFGGINSLQFASPSIAVELEKAEEENAVYWINAADPASPVGLPITDVIVPYAALTDTREDFSAGESAAVHGLRRVPSSRLCFRGSKLIAVSSRGGKELNVFIPFNDAGIAEALAFIKIPKTRKVHPENKIVIEKINNDTASKSPYSPVLVSLGFVKDRLKLILY